MTVKEKLSELEKENKFPSHIFTDMGVYEVDINDNDMMNDYIDNVTLCDIEFLLSDARGLYIPANFIECFDSEKWNISKEDKKELENPDNEFYWETWETILNNSEFIDENGKKWNLYHEGDLYAIHYY